MLARQQTAPESELARDDRSPPLALFPVKPQPNPDWAVLQPEVTAQYPKTLAYLAK